MFVYFARHYTSKVSRKITRQAVCENCRTVYAFQVTRSASGRGTSAYMVNNQGARRRAQERALAKLEAAIASAVDPVPCPTCGWFQSDMVQMMRARKHRWAMPVGLTVALAGGAIAMLLLSALSLEGWQYAALGLAGGLSVVGGVGLILYARHLRAHFDPNADHAARAGRPQVGVSVVSAAARTAVRPNPVAVPYAAIEESRLWHYARNGQVAGPVADSKLRQMAAQSELRPTDLVWHEDLPNWVEARSIDGLFSARSAASYTAQPTPQTYTGSAMQGDRGLDWIRVAILGGGIAVAISAAIVLFSLLLYRTNSSAGPFVSNGPVYSPPVVNPSSNPPVMAPPVVRPPVFAPPVFTPPVVNVNPPVFHSPILRAPITRPGVMTPPMISPPVGNFNPGRMPTVPSRRTAMVGGHGGSPYSFSDPQGRTVVGFRYEIGDWGEQSVVHSLDPLYDRGTAPFWSNDGKSGVLIGRPGYVVGGIFVDGRNYANAMRIIFMRQNGDHLDPADQYTTDWLGTPIDDTPIQLAGHGERVIGICGHKGLNFDALGLVIASEDK